MHPDHSVPKLPPRSPVPQMMHTRANSVEMRTTAQRILFPLRQTAAVQWAAVTKGNQALSAWAQYAEREHRETLINDWLYYKYDIETLKEYYINYLYNIERTIEASR